MKRYAMLITVLPAMLLAACSGYKSENMFGYGYSDTQLSENRYAITYKANEFTLKSRAHDFLMLRAAELAHEKGYAYVSLHSADLSNSTQYITGQPVGDRIELSSYDSTQPIFTGVATFYHRMPTGAEASMDTPFAAQETAAKIRAEYGL